MSFNKLWCKDVEKLFFINSKYFATPEQLFYKTIDDKYLAYWPKGYKGVKSTLQSRNSLIGNFTEKWVTDLLNFILDDEKLYAIQGAQCPSIGLTSRSSGDVVISDCNNQILSPKNIKMIFEVKMSLLWNWEFNPKNNSVNVIGDYKSHTGTPGILRSDSMLKSIGKCINIRVSNIESAHIPIVVIGNTPISKSYYDKVDHLKQYGIVQGFWSLNPKPLDTEDTIKETLNKGFLRIDNLRELDIVLQDILSTKLNFFSGMKSNKELGQIIELANSKEKYEEKGEYFLKLLKGE